MYSKQDIAEKRAKAAEQLTYGDKTQSRYDWIQEQRKIERTVRKERKRETAFRASGNKVTADKYKHHINELTKRYEDMTSSLGLQQTKERMRVIGNTAQNNSSSVRKMGLLGLKVKQNKQSNDILTLPIKTTDKSYKNLLDDLERLDKNGVCDYNTIKKHKKLLSEEKIIQAIAGSDQTKGSCASVALSYIGQKQGFDVLDFRGGESCEFFSSSSNLLKLSKAKGMKTLKASGTSSLSVGYRLLQKCEKGKEYFLCVGEHASIVRKKQ